MPKNKSTIMFGGWYQRTTLHLSEVYNLFFNGYSKLDLSKEKLAELHQSLDLMEVSREVENLEFVKAITNSAIEIRYYEDGLYVLQTESDRIKESEEILENYFSQVFNPAIDYIFSLGAPTPKVLANIKITHPVVVGVFSDAPGDYKIDKDEFGEVYSKTSSQDITVYKTREYIFVVAGPGQKNKVKDLMEMQIFFREFKDQLEKYLNIHRRIWEEISEIKEERFIKGKEIENVRTKLDSYQKTINLINSRINQMDVYVHTRASLSKDLRIEKDLITLFQYKFEVLSDTHAYIKEIWKMTNDYLATAIDILREIQNRSINNSIRSLQLIASIGVVAGLIGYLTRDSLPTITSTGVIYLLLLLIVIWPINLIITQIYKNMKYKLNFPEGVKNI